MLGLRNRIIWSIVITALLVSTVISVFAIVETRKIVEKEAYGKLLNYVEKFGAAVNQQLEEVEKNTKYVDGLVTHSFSWQAFRTEKNYMEHMKKSLAPTIEVLAQQASISKSAYVFFKPDLENKPNDVWYSDLNTGKVTRQAEFPLDYYNGDRTRLQWYYHPLDTGLAGWTDVYKGTVSVDKGVVYTSYTKPIWVDGKIVGVAGSDYYFDRLIGEISSIKLYQTGYAFLIDENFKVLVHPNIPRGTDLRTAFHGAYAPMIERAFKHNIGIEEYKWIDGREKLLVYSRLQNSWIIAMAPYKDEVFADAERLQISMYWALGISFLFAAFMGYNLGIFLTRPVDHLTRVTQAIGDGNYDLRIDSKYLSRKDEIGVLSNSVEQMRKRQQKSLEQIQSYNNELETLVADKTEALKVANEDLEQSLAQLEEQHADLSEVNSKLEISYETIVNTQNRLIESEKIAALGYLVNGVAHEVNTPVGNSITLSTHMEEETKRLRAEWAKAEMKKSTLVSYLDDMEQSAGHLFRNLNATMEVISRFKELATEKTQTMKTVFNPSEYIEMVVRGMSSQLGRKQINVLVECSKTLAIEGDPLRFSQIVSNLLSNAINHAFDDFEVGEIRIVMLAYMDSLKLTVVDNGSGIPDEDLKNIFVPFFSTKFGTQNKGLGLSVVHNIVHQVYDGEISVKTVVGRGTEVTVEMKNVKIVKL